MLMCLKVLVIFLIFSDVYVKMAHFMFLLKGLGWGVWARICSEVSCVLTGLVGLREFHCCVRCVVCVAILYPVVLCQAEERTFFRLRNGMPPICVQAGSWTGS